MTLFYYIGDNDEGSALVINSHHNNLRSVLLPAFLRDVEFIICTIFGFPAMYYVLQMTYQWLLMMGSCPKLTRLVRLRLSEVVCSAN